MPPKYNDLKDQFDAVMAGLNPAQRIIVQKYIEARVHRALGRQTNAPATNDIRTDNSWRDKIDPSDMRSLGGSILGGHVENDEPKTPRRKNRGDEDDGMGSVFGSIFGGKL